MASDASAAQQPQQAVVDAPTAPARALAPLAVSPLLLAAAVLHPDAYDPMAPLAGAPLEFWIPAFLAAAGPAATVVTARLAIPDREDRNRALWRAGAAWLAGMATTAMALLLVGPATLYKTGPAFALLMAAALAVAVVAGAVILRPGSRFRWGLLGGELVIALLTRIVFAAPTAPDEVVRHAMVEAPGWGRANLASLVHHHRNARRGGAADTARLLALESRLANDVEGGAFAPPYTAWGDDARVVRGWLLRLLAYASTDDPQQRNALLRRGSDEYLVVAASPATELEPFTADSPIARDLQTRYAEGLDAEEDVRLRVGLAWAVILTFLHEVGVEDPADLARVREAQAILRAIFEKHGLDRTHEGYLGTYTVDRRLLVLAEDGPGLLAFYDRMLAGPWPDRVKKGFETQAAFVARHPDEDYRPVMRLLRAQVARDEGDFAAAAGILRDLLETWPDASVAAEARRELAGLERTTHGD